MKCEKMGDELVVYLQGEIDHCSAIGMREEIEWALKDKAIVRLILDFSKVSFMDSSAIGMIIGRYKTMKARNGVITARGLHPPVEQLFHMAGLHRIIAEDHERQAKA